MPTGIYERKTRLPKPCEGCGTTDQTKFDDYTANGKTFRKPRCRECDKVFRRKRRTPIDKQAQRWAFIKYKYGLERHQYEMILKSQNGCCGICGLPFNGETPDVDHIDAPFHIRGLLHHKCNLIVQNHVTPDLLRKATEYLETKDKRFYRSK